MEIINLRLYIFPRHYSKGNDFLYLLRKGDLLAVFSGNLNCCQCIFAVYSHPCYSHLFMCKLSPPIILSPTSHFVLKIKDVQYVQTKDADLSRKWLKEMDF